MARLNKEEHDRILIDITEAADLRPDLMEEVQKLRDDFDESLTNVWADEKAGLESQLAETKQELEDVKKAYRRRFFTGPEDARAEAEDIVDRQKQDSPKSLRELFNLKEG